MDNMGELIAILTLPLKIVSMALLAVFSRMFHEKEVLSKSKIFTRIVLSTFVLWVVFVMTKTFTSFGDDGSLVIAGACAFAYREILDLWLGVAKNPLEISKYRNIFMGGGNESGNKKKNEDK